MNCSASGAHVQWFSCQKIEADNCDIMKWTSQGPLMLFWEGAIKESTPEPQACCLGLLILNVWVDPQVTDPVLWLSQCLSWSRA